MHLLHRHELLHVFFREIRGCSENIWSPRGPDDRSNKAPWYHCISKLVYLHCHSVCLRVQACANGIEKTNLTIHIYLPHFDFCCFYKVLLSTNSEKSSVRFFESTTTRRLNQMYSKQ
ncbi:hypothetical protein XENOCAPTIV_007905 [Xenoophorus captivus]|uniref:Uncharacterized protein n=1 Tax=Xenoophorus captivus TaxID=1517983 RepID=A0ABV0RG71_9TELE